MRTYLVGGAVRDRFIGRKEKERDYLVTGSTPEKMIAAGFKQVGNSFPVFIHPQTGEEYALARTERKTGPGHSGFAFEFSPTTTAEQDLRRRDFTVNAMAVDLKSNALLDPYGGRADCAQRLLKHVSSAFSEDPLRILRAVRLAAQLGFSIAPETSTLMGKIVAANGLAELSGERLWRELELGLGSLRPAQFIRQLRNYGILSAILPELDALFAVPQEASAHPEEDLGTHSMMAFANAVLNRWSPTVMLACLLHNISKGAAPAGPSPDHNGHEDRVAVAHGICRRLRLSKEISSAVLAAVREHRIILHFEQVQPAEILSLLERIGAFRSSANLNCLLALCDCVHASQPGINDFALHPNRKLVERCYRAALAAPVAVAASKAADPKGAVQSIRTAAIAAVCDA